MPTLLSKLVKYSSKKLHSTKCLNCKSVLDYMYFKDDQLIFRCFECKKNYQEEFDKDLIYRFANTYKFCNEGINTFILLLRKGVYPYEYMDSWERSNEISLPDKKAFYSNLYLRDITDKDYTHAQEVFKELKLENLANYHDLYVESDPLLLADIFQKFRNQCIEIYELDCTGVYRSRIRMRKE